MTSLKVYGLPESTIKILQEMGQKRLGKSSASAAIKLIVQDALLTDMVMAYDTTAANVILQEEKPSANPKSAKYRVVLRLPEKDYHYCQNNGQMFGMTASGFIVNLLRHYVDKHPSLSDSELKALYQSNYQLLRIGRNLNQIARQLNAGEATGMTTEEIQQLRAIIEQHTELVGNVFRSHKKRYE